MTELPLIALAQGRRARPRKAVVPRPREITLHMAVADLLRRFARNDWRWSHFPAGEVRDVRTGAKLRAMGVQKGWPDFLLFSPAGQLHALELKRQGETLSEDQETFREWCIACNVPHVTARSIDEALATLDDWRVLRVAIGGSR